MDRKITFSNYKNASIDDFYFDFARIWARDFKERSMFDLWLHTVDHASRIAKAVKRENPPAIIDDIADTVVWLMSFISFLENQLNNGELNNIPSTIICNKYPTICPVCFDNIIIEKFALLESKSPGVEIKKNYNSILQYLHNDIDNLYLKKCDCLTRITNSDKKSEIKAIIRTELDEIRTNYATFLLKQGKMPIKIIDIENMFQEIYENHYQLSSLESIMFNLLSEVGETTQAIVNIYTYDESREPYSTLLAEKRRKRLLEKIADIFSWLFAASIKIRNTYGKIAQSYYQTITKNDNLIHNIQGISFADIIWSKYGMTPDGANWNVLKCPGCQNAPCECPRDLKIDWQSTNEELIEEIPFNLNQPEIEIEKDKVFISYSHKDQKWFDELKVTLKPLIKNGNLSIWDDTRIQPGKQWREEIESALSRAKIAVLIVTRHFLASEFIEENELPPLLEAAKKGGTTLTWIPFSSSMYSETAIGDYQALCNPERPLDGMNKPQRNAQLVEICKKINSMSNI